MDTDVEVLIAGAGPTGLLLANELGLAGVRTAVVERLPQRTGRSKALNLQPRTAEVLDCRGLLEPVLDRSQALLPSGHFAGLPLDYGALDTAYPHQVGIPQARVEEFLEDHLAAYGVPVLRGRERAALARCPGPPRTLRAVRWASRFTDASRQAERYAVGRVLLAGDAAHLHAPAGGQGLNLGMQDAFNLGWKLAAVARGDAPDGLLATYHAERHPVGARVLANTRAQMVLTLPDPDAVVVRELLADLLTTPEANRRVAAMISGTTSATRCPARRITRCWGRGRRASGCCPAAEPCWLTPRQRSWPRRRIGPTASIRGPRPTAARRCWSARTGTSAGPAGTTTRTVCAPPSPVGSVRPGAGCPTAARPVGRGDVDGAVTGTGRPGPAPLNAPAEAWPSPRRSRSAAPARGPAPGSAGPRRGAVPRRRRPGGGAPPWCGRGPSGTPPRR
ncbi:FAD-dependent monooxygenase [Streptomyces platensis]|nr:FAD-dependent monooxygenase [Streptomyces platensis]